jgi:hypothetical protein
MSAIQILQHQPKQFGGHTAMAYYLFFSRIFGGHGGCRATFVSNIGFVI